VDIHNEVNLRNKKRVWDYSEAVDHYVGNKMEVCSVDMVAPAVENRKTSACIPWLLMLILIYALVCVVIKMLNKKRKQI
jgi:hypothetical protein